MKIFRKEDITYDNEYIKSLSTQEQEILFEGIALGQRMSASIIDSKLGNIMPKMNTAVVELIFKDVKQQLIVMLNMTKEQIKEMLNK